MQIALTVHALSTSMYVHTGTQSLLVFCSEIRFPAVEVAFSLRLFHTPSEVVHSHLRLMYRINIGNIYTEILRLRRGTWIFLVSLYYIHALN